MHLLGYITYIVVFQGDLLFINRQTAVWSVGVRHVLN